MKMGLICFPRAQMFIFGGLLVIKRVFKLPFSPYYPRSLFGFDQNFGLKWRSPRVSNPQGAEKTALFRRHPVDWTRGEGVHT